MRQLTPAKLERHLWGAADILRGSIDSADYKHYIFGLLFYKRLNDVCLEEYEERLEEYEDDELARDPEEHRFHIPAGCFWADVRKHSTDIGTELNTVLRAIEDANPRLRGVFQDVDFANRQRFPDHLLDALLQHFEAHRMRRADVLSTMLRDTYEYVIAQFADDAGKKGGEFYTPKLMVELLRPEEGATVSDPTCGSGGMLLADPVEAPYLRVANVQDGYADLGEVKTITLERKQPNRYALMPGDVLMDEGGDIDKLGRGDVWHGQISLCVEQNHVSSFRCGTRLSSRYLSYSAENPYRKGYFLRKGKQTTNLASINKTQLRELPVPLPPLADKRFIVARLDAVRRVAEELQLSCGQLKQLKAGLLTDDLTGTVRVAP